MTRGNVLGGLAVLVASVAASVLITSLVTADPDAVPEAPAGAQPATTHVVAITLERTLALQATAVADERAVDVQGVVTAAPQTDRLAPGTVVLEVNGRPLLAHRLPFPLWRDILPGDEGADVAAVQTGLVDLGLYAGQIDGVHGPATQAAVRSLYEQVGHRPPEPVGFEGVEAAEDVAESAQRALEQAEATDSEAPGYDAALAAARDTFADARDALADARAKSGTPLPSREVLAITGGEQLVGAVRIGDRMPEGPGLRLRSSDIELVVADEGAAADDIRSGTTLRLRPFDGAEQEGRVSSAWSDPSGASRIRLAAPPDGIEPGTTLALTVVLDASRGDVLAVPSRAVRIADDGTEHLRLADGPDGGTTDMPVTVGFVGDELVEVRGDIDEGDVVVLP